MSSALGIVYIAAPRTVEHHSAFPRHVTPATWKHRLSFAENPMAPAILEFLVFFEYLLQSPAGDHIASVDKAVEELGCAVNQLLLLFCHVLCPGVKIEDGIKGVVIVRNYL